LDKDDGIVLLHLVFLGQGGLLDGIDQPHVQLVRLLLVGSQELFHLPAGIASVREGINPNRLLQPLQGLLRLFRQAVDPRLRPIPSPGSLSGNENDQDKNADQGGDEYSRIDHLPFLVHSTTSAPDTVSSPRLSPAALFQGLDGQSQKQQDQCEIIENMGNIDDSLLKILQVVKHGKGSEHLPGHSVEGVAGRFQNPEPQQQSEGDDSGNHLMCAQAGGEQADGHHRRCEQKQAQISGGQKSPI